MTTAQPRPQARFRGLDEYPTAEQICNDGDGWINLASNESSIAPSDYAVTRFAEAARNANRYGDGSCALLRAEIGKSHGLAPDRIVCGSGSGELIYLLANAFAGSGDEVLMWRYGYLLFERAAKWAGAGAVRPSAESFADVSSLLAAVTNRTRVVFLDNPNNPTGAFLPGSELASLRRALRSDILLVIDAAYAEYVTADDYEPGATLVDAHHNVVMLRTFSKIYGLAGIRLGWAYCPEGVAAILNRMRLPGNVSVPAQAAGIAALSDSSRVPMLQEQNAKARNLLIKGIGEIGLTAYSSQGNFVLVRFPSAATANETFDSLKRSHILGRRMNAYGLHDCIRFTVGTLEQVQKLNHTIRSILSS